ncbi:IS1380 family transposase [Glutamicibacter arilaitensis]|uniref:IS1380 family transposase n=1 Tax=Glutamicibacter arilaitensis TaxID=256701 RepID=UPI003FD22694
MNHSTHVFPALPTQLTGQTLVSHAGLSVLTGFLNAVGFRALCEDRFSQFVPAAATHRPGKILGALALSLAAGGEQAADIDQLRVAPGLFGPVASDATVSRFMSRVKDQPDAFAYGFATMTRSLRSKENSAGTYKGGYGFSPMIAMADYGKAHGTGEVLAVQLRPGNRGANSAKSHIEVLNQALAQLPDDFYDQHGNLQGEKILVRTDSAGSSREFLHHLDSLGIQFSTSYSLPVIKERFIRWIDEKKYWEPALSADGGQRDDAWVIDASKVIELKDYPPGTRIYLRAEPLHPGAKATLFDTDGNRVTAFLTNAPRFNVAFLDARHRARGRCENRIKTLKSTGLGKLPYWSFAANQAWADLAMLALNLVSWLQMAVLPGGHAAGCWDMKRWRYRLFSMAGKVVTGGRQRRLLIPERAPEARLLCQLHEGIGTLFQRWRHGELAA